MSDAIAPLPTTRIPSELMTRAYSRLRQIARGHVGHETVGHTLQPTALVHEALLRVLRSKGAQINTEDDLCGLLATIMRHILVDHARAKQSRKRREGAVAAKQELAAGPEHDQSERLLELHTMIEQLAKTQPNAARYIELYYFGGMDSQAIAKLCGISRRSVQLEIALARRTLLEQITLRTRNG
ncbi:MAG: hypothetical protein CMJ35_08430 [Phycisphaerae bacterium]|nr:hypothetical protein [Phycisphaerae bacterium]MBM91624.1 hypothetical protein [Phycisphaerae bacterium]HCT45694.1 hypothetical protein [Phycisphaerales bacterium]